ncbi:MAG: helix-turn-helix domain-containing protein [Candidatus Deferrimicrobiaceae bacterium]|jgi:excisionase family DNA binding protein
MKLGGEWENGKTRLLSTSEVAKMLNLSRLHVQTLAVSRELPGVWKGKALLFHLDDVEHYMQTHRGERLAIA